MSIWILMESRDGGNTWTPVRGGNSYYRKESSCRARAEKENAWHSKLPPKVRAFGWKHKAVEFREVV